MKRFTLVSLFILAGVCFTFAQGTEVRNVGHFTALKAGGSFDVTVEKGSNEQVVIKADDGPIDRIITEVQRGTLNIYVDNDGWKNYRFRNVEIHVTFVELDKVYSSGSGNMYVKSPIKAYDLVVSSGGSGNLYCEESMSSESDARINNSGSGNLYIDEEVRVNGEVDINNSGSGNMKVYKIESMDMSVNNSGSGDLVVNDGQTTYQHIVMSGSGNVKMGGLRSKDCRISKSGSGTIYIDVEDELSGRSSGSGNIYLTRSSARLNMNTSGSGKIKTLN